MDNPAKNLSKLDKLFHEMCRKSKIADAPTPQLLDMYRAWNGGILAVTLLREQGTIDVDELIETIAYFHTIIDTEEEVRRAAP